MDKPINFYRTRIDRTVLKRLTAKSDLPGLIQSLGLLLLYSLTTLVTLYFFRKGQWAAMAVSAYVHAMFQSFLGMEASVHELSHKTAFKTVWLNEFFYGLFSFLTWNNPVHFRESHKRHHHYTLHKGKDLEVIIEPAPYDWRDYASWFLFDYKKFYQIMRTDVAHVFGRQIPDFFYWKPLFRDDKVKEHKMYNWARFMMAGHIVLLALFIYFRLWILIYLVTFSYFFVTFLGHSTGMMQHLGLASNIPDWRMSCHTMKLGPLMSFLYWRMNYHIEHHMYAAVPFFNLHRLHEAIAHDTPLPEQGYFRAMGKILSLLKKQKKDSNWYFLPGLPASASPPKMDQT